MIYPDTFEQKIGFTTLRQWLGERCMTTPGREYCEQMTFSSDYETVAARLKSTAEMLSIISDSSSDFPLTEVRDLNPIVKALRVPGSFIAVDDLRHLRHGLVAMSELSSFFESKRDTESGISSVPYLDKIASGLVGFPMLVSAIDKIIDRFGNVRDQASPELADIRRRMQQVSGNIASTMRRVMASAVSAGYIDDDVSAAMRDGRLVIPVSAMHKRRIPGIVHDESASGKTVYIEPAEIVEANNRVREIQGEERREIVRILTVFTDTLREYIPTIEDCMDIVAHIDFIHAKSVIALETGGNLPILERKPDMEWYHAVHPALLITLRKQGKEIVPLDITLSHKQRLLIISGPNAGGKSVCLKTAGIVQYMTQCGMLPPLYENSHMGLFSNIFIDIGDDQSIENDLSTYSSHLRNMKYFLQKGNASTLVLIDEFGGGTEPQIGGAIAQAVLEQFNSLKMWGVITTHYQNLKHFAEETEGLVNGSMLYDRQHMRPLFKLSIGNAGSSFAIEIARKTGLPESIIAKASELVGSDYINMDKYLLDIARDKRYWENKRLSIRQKEKKIEERLERYEHDAEELRLRRREIIDDARQQARSILDSSNAQIERTIHDIRRSQAEREATIKARQELDRQKHEILDGKTKEHTLLKKAPKQKNNNDKVAAAKPTEKISVGDNVKLEKQETVGSVLAIEGNEAIVAFGQLQTRVKLSRLRRTIAKAQSGIKPGASIISGGATSDEQRSRQLNFKQEIDLRGMRVDEAVQALTYYIDDAIRFNMGRVRILHGTGTGALRQYLRQYLDTVAGVKSYRDEHVQFGGAGITVVDLA
ncbi:MAG: Smr/MutS family protein [Muribaculum sp.]|nr:Smr/MutS family protein [Muribaculaceae bacterium]MCM1081398.1 Smr/MutS family protein [Muribaculum sp.]